MVTNKPIVNCLVNPNEKKAEKIKKMEQFHAYCTKKKTKIT